MSFAKPRPVHTTVLCRLQTRSASHPAHLSALAAVMPHAKCAVTRALIAAVYGIDRGSVLRSLTPVTVAEHRTACWVPAFALTGDLAVFVPIGDVGDAGQGVAPKEVRCAQVAVTCCLNFFEI